MTWQNRCCFSGEGVVRWKLTNQHTKAFWSHVMIMVFLYQPVCPILFSESSGFLRAQSALERSRTQMDAKSMFAQLWAIHCSFEYMHKPICVGIWVCEESSNVCAREHMQVHIINLCIKTVDNVMCLHFMFHYFLS